MISWEALDRNLVTVVTANRDLYWCYAGFTFKAWTSATIGRKLSNRERYYNHFKSAHTNWTAHETYSRRINSARMGTHQGPSLGMVKVRRNQPMTSQSAHVISEHVVFRAEWHHARRRWPRHCHRHQWRHWRPRHQMCRLLCAKLLRNNHGAYRRLYWKFFFAVLC